MYYQSFAVLTSSDVKCRRDVRYKVKLGTDSAQNLVREVIHAHKYLEYR